MFFDYLAYIGEQQITNPVVAQRHYVEKGHRLPRVSVFTLKCTSRFHPECTTLMGGKTP